MLATILKALFLALANHFQIREGVQNMLEERAAKKQDAKTVEDALAGIQKPVDESLSQPERESQSENDFDDYFDKLKRR